MILNGETEPARLCFERDGGGGLETSGAQL